MSRSITRAPGADRPARTRRRLAAVVTALGLAATAAFVVPTAAGADEPDDTFRLQILHASDLEGGVEAIGRAPSFAAIVEALENSTDVDASITLSAGDNYIPGPFFAASSDPSVGTVLQEVYAELGITIGANQAQGGRSDITIMNVIDFDASAVGNHEWDLGSNTFQAIIQGTPSWPGARFPYLSANLDFSGDAAVAGLFTPNLLPNTAFVGPGTPQLAPFTTVEAGGETIGVVGATTQILETISSPTGTQVIGPKQDDMPALAQILQPRIDQLTGAGIDKIVLVSHLQQFSLEQQLAGLITDVDIIIAGGSDTINANADDRLADGSVAALPYPVVVSSASSEPVAIVSTDGEYSYVGRLVVDFDADGLLVVSGGAPLTSFDQLDLSLNGPVISDEQSVVELWGSLDAAFTPGSKGELVQRLVGALQAVVVAKDSNVIGETTVFLEGRRSEIRTQETNLGNLTADANLQMARVVDPTVAVSLKNGGGVRAEIGEVRNVGDETLFLPPQFNPLSGKLEGQVSQLDIENSLRFNNTLSLVTVTATELRALMEHGVAASGPGLTQGRFPQIGGMRFSYDVTRPAGSRIDSLVIVTEAGSPLDYVVLDGVLVGDPDRAIRMVTLNFLAGGGDQYPFPVGPAVDRVDLVAAGTPLSIETFGTEQNALAEFFRSRHGIGTGSPYSEADTPPELDERIQDLTRRADSLPPTNVVVGEGRIRGTTGDDVIFGSAGNDTILPSPGNDIIIPGDGNDTIHGGPGSNVYVLRADEGDDTILGFDVRNDVLDVSLVYETLGDVLANATFVRGGVVIALGDGSVRLQGRKLTDLDSTNVQTAA